MNKEELDVREKALLVIEHMAANDELWDYFKFAHITLGDCSNPHNDWVRKLNKTYNELKLSNLI